MLFVLTSCSLLPDSRDRSERQAFTTERRQEQRRRWGEFPSNAGITTLAILWRLCSYVSIVCFKEPCLLKTTAAFDIWLFSAWLFFFRVIEVLWIVFRRTQQYSPGFHKKTPRPPCLCVFFVERICGNIFQGSLTHPPSFSWEDGIWKGLGVTSFFSQRRPQP